MPRTPRHVVVDGSNIATEGRSLPSLAQLDEAVRAFMEEHPGFTLTVVVDATFGHRIDESERQAFDEAEAANEVVSPPAGAIGRGDAFLLRIADKVGATVFSNDSFQEFHGEYPWLFDEGRLIGGKPVPGIGWIFTPRTPVRGPKSRESVKEAKRKKKADVPEPEHGLEQAAKAKESKPKTKKQVDQAIATATDEAVEGDGGRKRRRRRRGGAPPAEPVNDPGLFFAFVTSHPLGSHVTGRIDTFASHGAFVTVDETRCYIPLSAMGDPPPRAAKEVLNRGEDADFVVQAFDPSRRGIELALPAFAHLAGRPTDETVEAEIAEAQVHDELEAATPVAATPRRRTKKAAAAAEAVGGADVAGAPAGTAERPPPRPVRKRAAKKGSLPIEEAPPAPEPPLTAEPATEPPAAAAAPGRKRGRKASAVVEPAAAPTAPTTPAPAKKRGRKAAASPAVPAAPVTGAEAPPAATPSRAAKVPKKPVRNVAKAAAATKGAGTQTSKRATSTPAKAPKRTTKKQAAPEPATVSDAESAKASARKEAAKKAAATRAAKRTTKP